MMGRIRRLLAGAQRDTGRQLPCWRPDHPAREPILEAATIADRAFGVDLADRQASRGPGVPDVTAVRLLGAIDRALQRASDHPELLFAKSEAYCAIGQAKAGEALRVQVLGLGSRHFDATMRHFHPREWPNLFTYPGWSEDSASVPEPLLGLQVNGEIVQIVRDRLTLSPLLLLDASRERFPAEVDECRWRPLWIETPDGPIFEHYVMLRLRNGAIHRTESMVSPYPVEPVGPRRGHWLIRRLSMAPCVFIVFNDGEDVVFNRRLVFPPALRRTLRKIGGKLSRVLPLTDHEERVRRAAAWYTTRARLEDVPF